MTLIAGFVDDAREIGAQSFDVRLHARACTPFGPKQFFGKLRRPGALSLRPDDERLAQPLFPLPKRAPKVAVRTSQGLRRMPYRAEFQHRAEKFEERIAERRATLFAGLEGVPQVQSEGGLRLGCNFGVPHPPPRDQPIYSGPIVP